MANMLTSALRLSFALATTMGLSALSAAPPAEGTVSVEAGSDAAPGLLSASTDAVGQALTERGLTVLEGRGHGRFVAEVRLTRSEVGTGAADVRAPKGLSAANGRVSVALPSSKSRTVALQETRMEIRLRKRDEPGLLWRGEAVTVRAAEARNGGDGAVATDLVAALFRAYPAQAETVIGVP